MTVAGTVASLLSLLDRFTVNGPVVAVLRLTVAVVVPLFSLIDDATMLSVNDGASSSVTFKVSVPDVWAIAVAVTSTD